MAVEDINKPFSCWTCRHYQARRIQGVPQNDGECRALPPIACCPTEGEMKDDRAFPIITTADKTWCSSWLENKTPLVQGGGR